MAALADSASTALPHIEYDACVLSGHTKLSTFIVAVQRSVRARDTLNTHHQSKPGNGLRSRMVDLTEHVEGTSLPPRVFSRHILFIIISGFYLIHREDRRLDMVSTESIRFQHLPLQRDVP